MNCLRIRERVRDREQTNHEQQKVVNQAKKRGKRKRKKQRNAHWVVSFRMKAKLLLKRKMVPLVFHQYQSSSQVKYVSKWIFSLTRKKSRIGWVGMRWDGARVLRSSLIVEKSSFDDIVLI